MSRGGEISALWLLAAALGSYAIAYRFALRDPSRVTNTEAPYVESKLVGDR